MVALGHFPSNWFSKPGSFQAGHPTAVQPVRGHYRAVTCAIRARKTVARGHRILAHHWQIVHEDASSLTVDESGTT